MKLMREYHRGHTVIIRSFHIWKTPPANSNGNGNGNTSNASSKGSDSDSGTPSSLLSLFYTSSLITFSSLKILRVISLGPMVTGVVRTVTIRVMSISLSLNPQANPISSRLKARR